MEVKCRQIRREERSLPLRPRLDQFLGQVVRAWSLTAVEDAGGSKLPIVGP
jgi:hypothetical protein